MALPLLLVDLFILGALAVLGYWIARLILGRVGSLEAASLSFPLGGGVLTWILFLLSWLGLPLTPLMLLLTYAFTLGMTILAIRAQGPQAGRGAMHRRNPASGAIHRTPRIALWALLVVVLAITVPLAIGRAHSRWDAAAGWIVKGYGIALEGDIRAAATWGAWGLAYPLNIPLQVAAFRLLTQDLIPGSMLLFPSFAVSIAAGLYRFWRREGLGGWPSLLGVGLFITNPLILLHATIGYTNLPVTGYVILGICWLIEGLERGDRRSVLLGSLLFGMASWTRSEAVSYGLFLLPVILLVFRLARKRSNSLLHALGPFLVMAGSWFAFGWTSVESSHLGKAMNGVLPVLLRGEYRLFELYLIPRLLLERALDPRQWGLLFPISGVLILIGLPRVVQFRTHPRFTATFLSAGITCAIPIGLFYVRSFTRYSDFIPLLNRSFDRAFLPGATMLLILGMLTAFAAQSRGSLYQPEQP